MVVSRFSFLLPCLLGAIGLFLARRSGDGTPGFYAATAVTALVYLAAWRMFGSRSMLAGPRVIAELLRGVLIGAVLAGVFVAGAVVVSRIPFLAEPVGQLLSTTTQGGIVPTLLVLVVNGVGEELVFRDVVPRQLRRRKILTHPVSIIAASVALYCLVTMAMGVWLLIFAAAALGTVAHLEAARSGRLHSPIALHLTWSIGMLFLLPLFFQ